jgi:hypothetical protein
MTEPTPEPAAPIRRTWMPSFLQIRLGILMAAIILGISGMARNDSRIVNAAIVIGAVGVILRFVRPKQNKGP